MTGISGASPNQPKKHRKNANHVMWNARIGVLGKSSRAAILVAFCFDADVHASRCRPPRAVGIDGETGRLGGAHGHAGFQVEAPAVQRADHRGAADDAVAQRAAFVRAAFSIVRKRPFEIEDRDFDDRRLSRARPSRGGMFSIGVIAIQRRSYELHSSNWLNLYELRGIDGLLAFQPCIVRKRLRSREPIEQAALLFVRRVDRFLADLFDAQPLDEIVAAFQVVGVLAVVLEEQLGGLQRLLPWFRP